MTSLLTSGTHQELAQEERCPSSPLSLSPLPALRLNVTLLKLWGLVIIIRSSEWFLCFYSTLHNDSTVFLLLRFSIIIIVGTIRSFLALISTHITRLIRNKKQSSTTRACMQWAKIRARQAWMLVCQKNEMKRLIHFFTTVPICFDTAIIMGFLEMQSSKSFVFL